MGQAWRETWKNGRTCRYKMENSYGKKGESCVHLDRSHDSIIIMKISKLLYPSSNLKCDTLMSITKSVLSLGNFSFKKIKKPENCK